MNATGFKTGIMPKSVICYICGRGYGTKSINIHLKNCQKKWDIEQEKKPIKNRKPCPQPPKGYMESINKTNVTHKDLEKINNVAFEEYNDIALEPCHFCGRTFNAEAFLIHKRICTSEKPFKPINTKQSVKPIMKPNIEVDKPNIKKTSKVYNKSKEVNKTLQLQDNYQFIFTYNGVSSTTKLTPDNQKQTNNVKKQEYDINIKNDDNKDIKKPVQCVNCHKVLANDKIDKHKLICNNKNKQNKNDLLQETTNTKTQESNNEQIPKWKEKHLAMVENLQYIRKVKRYENEGKDIKDIPVPENKLANNDLKSCTYCERKFNEEAYIRHTKICKNVVNKPKNLKNNYSNKKAAVHSKLQKNN